MSSSEIVEFLAARYDERERTAKAATPGTWSADSTGTVCADADLEPDGNGGEILPPGGPSEVAECYRNERPGERGHNAEHMAANDPAFVLADLAAKRAILGLYEQACERVRNPVSADAWQAARVGQFELEQVLRALAMPFADHPEFRDEWRVT